MILIDANIFMYAAGAPHPHKMASVELLDAAARGVFAAAVDAEVLQEILHRYRAIKRWKDGRQVFDLARRIVPIIVPITAEVLDEARLLLDERATLMARDALHAAVARLVGAEALCSYDTDLDGIEGVVRKEPAALL